MPKFFKTNKKNSKPVDLTKVGKQNYRDLQQQNAVSPEEYNDFMQNYNTATKVKNIISNNITLDNQHIRTSLFNPETGNGFGDSMFDDDFVSGDAFYNLNDERANNQPWYSKLGAGLAKAGVLAATTFVDGILGTAAGIVNGIDNISSSTNKSQNGFEKFLTGFWDNPVSNLLKEVNDTSEEAMPNYYTQDEIDNPWSNIFTANFLGDKFIKNLGFSIGAFYSGGIFSKGLKGLLSLAKVSGSVANASTMLTGAFMSALNEGKTEALNNSTDWKKAQIANASIQYQDELSKLQQQYDVNSPEYKKAVANLQNKYDDTRKAIEEQAANMGNADLVMNLPILMASNVIQFGKLYSKGFSSAIRDANVTGSLAEGFQAVKTGNTSKLIKAFGKSFGSEGTEEISQYAASNIAGLHSQDVVKNYIQSKYDPNATKEVISWGKSFAEGVKDTVSDPEAWQEFFIGGLTGLVGMPQFRSAKNADGTYRSPIVLEDNIFSRIKEENKKEARSQELADYMNKRSKEMLPYYQGLVRHVSFENQKKEAVDRNSKFDFKNADDSQLVSDIQMFDDAGKLDELKSVIKMASENMTDEDIDNIIEATTKNHQSEDVTKQINQNNNVIARLREKQQSLADDLDAYSYMAEKDDDAMAAFESTQAAAQTVTAKIKSLEAENEKLKENNKVSGPYVDNNGNPLSKEEVRKSITENRENLLKTLDNYRKNKNYFESIVRDDVTDDQVAELTWLQTKSDLWKDRLNSFNKETRPITDTLIKRTEEFISNLTGTLEALEADKSENRDKERIKRLKSYIDDGNTLLGLLKGIYVTDGRLLADTDKGDYSEIDKLIDLIDDNFRSSDLFSVGELEKYKENLKDSAKISSALIDANNKLKEYTTDPAKLAAEKQKATEQAINNENNTKVEELKEKLKQAKNIQGIREILKGNDEVIANQALMSLTSEKNPLASEYKKIKEMEDLINKELEKAALTDSELSDAKKASKAFIESISNSDEVYTKSLDNPDFLDNEGIEDPDELVDRVEKAKVNLATAIIAAKKGKEWLSKFSEPTKVQPTTKQNNNQTTEEKKEEPKQEKPKVEKPKIEKPVGSSTSEKNLEDVKELNSRTIEPVPTGSPTAKVVYIKPIIPELSIDGSREGDFRPFNVVVKEKEGLDFDKIYNFLVEQGAFDALNKGRVKAGDSVVFTIVPQFDESTIFMSINGIIVGSLPTAENKLKQVEGLYEMVQGIKDEYESFKKVTKSKIALAKEKAEREGKELEEIDENPTFKSVKYRTHVDKVMIGKVPYTEEEHNLNSIVEKHNRVTVRFAIVKNGSFVTNDSKISNDDILIPNSMSNKNGALYALVPNGVGKYTPVAVRVQHFNEDMDLNSVSYEDSPIIKDLKTILTKISKVQDNDVLKDLVEELKEVLYLGGININFIEDEHGSLLKISKPKLDSNGDFIIDDNNKIVNDNRTIQLSSKSIVVTENGSEEKVTETPTKDVYDSLVSILQSYNLPLQVQASRINSSGYNSRLIESGILYTNASALTTKGTWFTANPLDANGKEIPAQSPKSIAPTQGERFRQSTVAKNSDTYTIGGQKFYVPREGVYLDNDGNKAEPSEELIYMYWADKQYGSKTEGIGMTDNKVVCPNNRVLDRTTGTFLEGAEAQAVIDKVFGVTKKNQSEKTKDTLAAIDKSQEAVDKSKTDSDYYYILEEDGEYHPYSRVHSAIDEEFGPQYDSSDSIKKAIKYDKEKIDKSANDLAKWKEVLQSLQYKYAKEGINLEPYFEDNSATARQEIYNLLEEAAKKKKDNSIFSQRALKNGTMVDTVVRDFFNGVEVRKPDDMSEGVFNTLLQSLKEIRDNIVKNGQTFYANNIVLYTKYPNGKRVAGEIDILAVDKNGNFHIYDVKTSGKSTQAQTLSDGTVVNNFLNTKKLPSGAVVQANPKYRRSPKDQYTIQLSSYKNLFENMFGVEIKSLAIIPFKLDYGPNTSNDTALDIHKEKGITLTYNSHTPVEKLKSNTTEKKETKKENKKESSNKPLIFTNTEVDVDDSTKKYDSFSPNFHNKEVVISYEYEGKIHKSHAVRLTNHTDNELYLAMQVKSTVNTGLGVNHFVVEKADYILVAPNGATYILSANSEVNPSDYAKAVVDAFGNNLKPETREIISTLLNSTSLLENRNNNNSNDTEVIEVKEEKKEQEKPVMPSPVIEQPTVIPAEEKQETKEEKKDESIDDLFDEINNLSDSSSSFGVLNVNEELDSDMPAPPTEDTHDDDYVGPTILTLREVDKKRKTWNREEELSWLSRALPQFSLGTRVQIVQGLLQVAGRGNKAWGQYSKGIITLSDVAAEGTTYHEAFHAVFNLMLDSESRKAILAEAKAKYNVENTLELEELLAEDFRRYVMGEQKQSLGRRILNFFKSLFTKTKHWNSLQPTIMSLYSGIQNGDFSKVDIKNEFNNTDGTIKTIKESRDFTDTLKDVKHTTWESLDKTTLHELLVKGWTKERFNLISQEEKEMVTLCSGV